MNKIAIKTACMVLGFLISTSIELKSAEAMQEFSSSRLQIPNIKEVTPEGFDFLRSANLNDIFYSKIDHRLNVILPKNKEGFVNISDLSLVFEELTSEDTITDLALFSAGGILCGNCQQYLNDIGIQRVEIAEGPTEIEGYTFFGCNTISEFKMPDSITRIGNEVFGDRNNEMKIYISSNLSFVGHEAFGDDLSQITFFVPSVLRRPNEQYVSWYMSNCLLYIEQSNKAKYEARKFITVFPPNLTKIKTIRADAENLNTLGYASLPNLEETFFTKKVKKISKGIFKDCKNLKKVDVEPGNSLEEISQWAFAGCEQLISISIPKTVTIIGDAAFSQCSSLKTIEFPPKLEKIENCAFYKCYNLTGTLLIPITIQKIGGSAFDYCRAIVSIDILNSNGDVSVAEILKIDRYAFYNCASIESIKFAGKNIYMENNSFYFCNNLSDIYFPNAQKVEVGNSVFSTQKALNFFTKAEIIGHEPKSLFEQ